MIDGTRFDLLCVSVSLSLQRFTPSPPPALHVHDLGNRILFTRSSYSLIVLRSLLSLSSGLRYDCRARWGACSHVGELLFFYILQE